MNKKFTYIKIVLLALAAFTIGLFIVAPAMKSVITKEEKSAEREKEPVAIGLSFDYGDGNIESYSPKAQEGETLFELMHRMEIENKVQLSYKNFSGLGILIESIGEKKNGEGGAYWQYWINNEYAKVGASEYIPKNGDTIQWKFTPHHNRED